MPSPFPGMDPFIEGQAWEDFHHEVIAVVRESLMPRVRPRYVVRVEERIYLEHVPEEPPKVILPDVAVLRHGEVPRPQQGGQSGAAAVAVEPIILTVPMPEPVREAYLTVRERETMAVVTVIEVLSPKNKRRGGDGRREYLRKREGVLESPAHLVELDLLRGGERPPTVEPLPAGDYYAFVSREARRPQVEVYAWPLRHPLPPIPIPLSGDDADVPLDLSAIFTTVYDRAGYDYSLDYGRPLEPPLAEPEAEWVRKVLEEDARP